MKEKLDDVGVSNAASNAASKVKAGGMYVGGFIASTAKAAGGKISSTIDGNEKLSSAKDVTKEKLGQAASYMSYGWSSLYSKVTGKKPEA